MLPVCGWVEGLVCGWVEGLACGWVVGGSRDEALVRAI